MTGPQVPAEDYPTGTAWRPARTRPWTPEEQDRHWDDLGEAISDWRVGDAGRPQGDRRQGHR
ncbi:hypothetical protein AB0M23_28540 [Streptomyces sp. NPDC052077]|uniref:hypothetical protein n=1 Tax=Streptomyces sp. NPDC052077 TaxID=3154757 RepID=UPI003413D02A